MNKKEEINNDNNSEGNTSNSDNVNDNNKREKRTRNRPSKADRFSQEREELVKELEKNLETNEYIIFDGVNKYIVSKEILLKYFMVTYCITLYTLQGKTFNKIHYVKDERDRQALIKDGALYTLISRLKFEDKENMKLKH